MNLTEFLLENDISNLTEQVRISKRIPYDFKIKALSAKKFKEFQARCRSKVNKGGLDFDTGKLQTLVCLECCVEPSFSNADFVSKLGVITPEEAMEKTLLPGEIAELYAKISELSGFDTDINEDIETAKN